MKRREIDVAIGNEIASRKDDGKFRLEYVKACHRTNDSYNEDENGELWYGFTDGSIEELIEFDLMEKCDLLELLEDGNVTIGSCCNTYYLVPRQQEVDKAS